MTHRAESLKPEQEKTGVEEIVALSAILADALGSDGKEKLTVGAVLDRIGDRGFGIVLILLALPTLIPVLPPGASAVVGTLYVLIGIQLVAGLETPWLPKRVRAHRLSVKTLGVLRNRGVRIVKRIEKVSRPRWEFMHAPMVVRVLGLLIIGIGILLFLPLPFMNTLPALAMLVMGVGLSNRDGVLMVVGAVIGSFLVYVAVRFGHVLFLLYEWLKVRVLQESPP